MDTVYGLDDDQRDHFVAMANELMSYFAEALKAGRFLVDLIPASRVSFFHS